MKAASEVEIRGISRYSTYADAFVRQFHSVCTPAGGEMSGLTAHFLFAANCFGAHRVEVASNPFRIIRLQAEQNRAGGPVMGC